MNPDVYSIQSIIDVNNFSRNYCVRCIKKNNRKCESFYRKLANDIVTHTRTHTCPYGYMVITFSDQIIPSLIGKDTDLVLLKRRDKYPFTHMPSNVNKPFIDERYDIYDPHENECIYGLYSKLFYEYSGISRFLHDISNSIGFFLDINVQSSDYIFEELTKGHCKINEILMNIKKIKSDYLGDFMYTKDYQKGLELLKGRLEELSTLIAALYEQADQICTSQSTKPDEFNLLAGYGLFKTLWDYYNYDNNKLPNHEISNHRPHKMMKKLSKMLQDRARKRGVRIMFSPDSYNENVIRNYSDIYIAFFSILENAIKYSLNGGTIEVEIHDTENDCVIKIANSCEDIGINDLNTLFIKGKRGMNAKQDNYGSGFGLFLVAEIFNAGNILYSPASSQGEFSIEVRLTNISN